MGVEAALPLVLLLVGAAGDERSCEPIAVEMCKGVGYNATGMPNLAGHTLQADVEGIMQTFSPLLQYGCSSQLHFFLCSVYAPMCTDKVAEPIGPCANVCEAVRARCYPVLEGFGFPWPPEFDCARFPESNDRDHMCMEGPGERGPPPEPAPRPLPGPDCPDLHSAADERLAEVWLSIWAALCFAATLFAAPTAMLAGERRLGLLALCHNLTAVGWGVRAVVGRPPLDCAPARLPAPDCALVFALLYYFGSAATLWWVALVAQWRATVRGAASDGGPPVRLLAWALPAVQTVTALALGQVDADELTGVCYVGNRSSRALVALAVAPQLLYLTVGCCALASGLAALPAAAARAVRRPGDDADPLRPGIFAVIYAACSFCALGTWLYEYARRDSWRAVPRPSPAPSAAPRPALAAFLLRILTTQILGVLVALWIVSPGAIRSWRCAFGRAGPPARKPPPSGPLRPIRPLPLPPRVLPPPERPRSRSERRPRSRSASRTRRSQRLRGGETTL